MFHESPSRLRARRSSVLILVSTLLCLAMPALVAATTSTPVIMPLDEVKAGMKGVGYTIFSGDKVEPFNLVVLGILPDLLGPKQSIILVQLVGQQVEHTGVVAGMSGSPVYIDGKLIGALSLKLGQFTKDPIAGITPIENMLEISASDRGPTAGDGGSQSPANTSISYSARPRWQRGVDAERVLDSDCIADGDLRSESSRSGDVFNSIRRIWNGGNFRRIGHSSRG
jgi:SpoIVB peptidase S55